ncbi:MAG: tRNA pseudouridine(55) synthase TruB [Butyricicoccus sp.]|nr:tRNA pseudouridine(55) synthase TruB [Butyricicoccus sp.]
MNGILLIDKPEGWTSHDVVAKLRGVLHERRAGHSGTLDPMATGLLVLFFGRATRAVEFAGNDVKEYRAGIRFGVTTDTQDITGRVLSKADADFTAEQLDKALQRFRGDILQLPPMYSAIKVGGKKLYEIARRGGEVERKPREVHIFSLERESGADGEIFLNVRCSKGTYIRTLCHDIGQALGCGACMSSLRRTRAGAFDVAQAYSIEQVQRAADSGGVESLLLPVDTLFSSCGSFELSDKQEKCLRNGGTFTCSMAEGRYRAYSSSGEFIALAEVHSGEMRTIKSFFEV